jgi:hypothetical protein
MENETHTMQFSRGHFWLKIHRSSRRKISLAEKYFRIEGFTEARDRMQLKAFSWRF